MLTHNKSSIAHLNKITYLCIEIQNINTVITMERNFVRDELDPDCPIRNVLNRISDKWTLLVLYTLNKHDSIRFRDLYAEIPDISQKMLVLTLRTLESDGLVERKAYAEVPPRVEYALTGRAHSLFPIIDSLIQWAKNHFHEILLDRTKAKSHT